LLIDIYDSSIVPRLLDLLSIPSYALSVMSNMAWLKRWGDQFTLMAVEIALTTEDAIADYGTKDVMDGHTFIKVVGVFYQNAVNVLWPIKENAREWPEVHANYIVLASHALEQAQAIFGKFKQIPSQRIALDKMDSFVPLRCAHFCCHKIVPL
jgi:hypothetical protein